MTRSRLPLWAVLSLPFALVLSLVVGTLVYSHQKSVHQLINAEGVNVLRSNNAHVTTLLGQYLELPFQTHLTLADTIQRQRLFNANNLSSVQDYFYGVFTDILVPHFKQLEMIQLGTESGNFVGFQREADGQLSLMLKDHRTGSKLEVHRNSGPQVDQLIPDYDPRVRPWYKPVSGSLKPRWSELYISGVNPDWVGISAMAPLLQSSSRAATGAKDALLGVLSIDLSLTELSRFLRETHLHQTFSSAVIYIVDAKGQLVAQSIAGPLVSAAATDGKRQFLNVSASNDAIVRSSFQAIKDLGHSQAADTFITQVNGEPYFGSVSTYADPRGLDWRIVTLVSSAELTGDAERQSRWALTVAIGLVLAGGVMGLLIFRRISHPIHATAEAAKDFASRDDPMQTHALVPVQGNAVRETHQLAQAFNAMATRISAQMTSLQDLALKDAVTGLLNVNGLIKSSTWHQTRACTVAVVAVHNLSLVNASLGAKAGDQLLHAIAARLLDASPLGTTWARGTGAEFIAVHLDGGTGSDSTLVARLISCFIAPFVTDTDDLLLQASIGVFSGPCTGHEIETSALRKASLALRQAKANRNVSHVVYDDSLESQAKAAVRMATELKAAIERKQLLVYFQPIVSLETGLLHGLESLVRWPHTNGMIPPSTFVPVAEESGLIVDLGNWIMLQACTELAQWMRATPLDDGFALHVNVSVRQLVQADFVDVVAKVLEESTLAAKHLTIEITESMLMQESASTLTTINRLRKLGCVIALDDFGTGYSSLSYLNRFPFHDIKIDRSFLLEAEKSDNSAAILRAVVELTKGLGVASVAEGVETYSQAGMLRRLGCTYGQGYLYGRPAPLEQAMTPFMTKPSFTEAAGQT